MSTLAHSPATAVSPTPASSRGRLRGLARRVAAGADLVLATQRMDIARILICWADLKRG